MRRGRPPQKDTQDAKNYFEVEKICKKRLFKGNTEYLVKWKDFEQEQATWETPKNLAAVQDLIEEFEDSLKPKEIIKEAFKREEQAPEDAEPLRSLGHSSQPEEGKLDQISNDDTTEQKEPGLETKRYIIQTPFDVPKKQILEQNTPFFPEKESSTKRMLDNTEIDISFEARQLSTRFQILGQKIGKKEQLQEKKKLKKLERLLCKPATEFLTQENVDGNSNWPEKERYRMHLRDRKQLKEKNNPPSITKRRMAKKRKEKIAEESQQKSHSKKNEQLLKAEKSQQEMKMSILAKRETYVSVNQAIRKKFSEKNEHIVSIRMLENQPNKLAQYLVQYDSGQLKIFKTTELIVSHPIEFAEYLDKKHTV